MNENDEKLLERLIKIENKMENIENNTMKDISILYKKYDGLAKESANSTINIQRILVMMEQTSKDMEESKKSIEDIKKSVDEINAIPNKRWEGVINTALGCIVSVIIGAILALVIK